MSITNHPSRRPPRLKVLPLAVRLLATVWMVLAAATAQANRTTLVLADGWRFLQDDRIVGAEQPDFPDGAWAQVRVPHTWNHLGGAPEAASGSDQTRGVGWYRLNFDVPHDFAGRRLWLQFDAASEHAEVWLNGIKLGAHDGGFSRFRLDATGALSASHHNTLAVKTDNSIATRDSATANILPIAGDFFVYGGLYRPVSLLATDALHIDLLDHGGPGVTIRTDAIAGDAAQLSVQTLLVNELSRRTTAELVVAVRDAAGRVVASSRESVRLAPRSRLDRVRRLQVAHAHLWNGVPDPYLYQVSVEIRSRSGQVLDRVQQRFGIRQLRIDPELGLFLNGHSLKLHGVALHQDREGRGWAQSDADQRDDMAMIVEMGANSIRFTHYQHSDYLNDLADELGLIDWAEIPLVTRWTLGHALEPTPELVENARQQLIELIRQSVNHASIGVWSIANEIDFGRKLPRVYHTAELPDLDPLPLLAKLRALAHAEDPSRPTAIANCCYGRPNSPTVVDAADLSGLNRYFGWYYGAPGDLVPVLSKTHADYPSIPLAMSEYGAGGAVTQATDNPLGGPVDPYGKTQPEEYQAYVHELTWPLLAGMRDVWGTWLTFMFDFASPLRREGDSVDINTKGMVTFDRKTRKDAYFFYKANWNPAPTVYIASRRHLLRVLPVTDIKVYSNARSTELWVNDKALGAMADCPGRICVWRAVRLSSGANVVHAVGSFASGTRDDSVTWTLGVGEGVYRIDCGAIEGSLGPGGRYGSDDFFSGGTAAVINLPVNEAAAIPPPHEVISGTAFESLVNSYRKGTFSYRLPLADGKYRVRLWFVEPDAKQGQRLFSVLANGAPMLANLDVAAAAGGVHKALERSFRTQAERGALRIDFIPAAGTGEAIVSAIDVEPDQ